MAYLKIENQKSTVSEGFTLFEIIIAIFIFSIIVTTVFGFYNTVFSTASVIEKDTPAYEGGKNSLNRMILDLQAIAVTRPPEYKVPDIDDPPDPYRLVGDTTDEGGQTFGRLRFTSLAHIPFRMKSDDEIAEIIYYVQSMNNEEVVLRRQNNLFPYPDFEEKYMDPILCRNIQSLTFTFYDEEGDSYENWDSESEDFDRATPREIEILMAYGEKESPIYFKTRIALPVYREKIE